MIRWKSSWPRLDSELSEWSTAGPGAVPRGHDLYVALSALLAGRSDDGGQLGRGTVSFPGSSGGRVWQPPSAAASRSGLAREAHSQKERRRALPAEIWQRHKQPYRAPIHRPSLPSLAAVDSALRGTCSRRRQSRRAVCLIRKRWTRLCAMCRPVRRVSEVEDMALVGVLSTQLLHHQFVGQLYTPDCAEAAHPVRICRGKE